MVRPMLNQFVRLTLLLLLAWLLVACGSTEPPATDAATAVAEPTDQPAGEGTDPPAMAIPSGDAVEESAGTSSATEDSGEDVLSGLRVLAIDPAQSEARFLIDEVLLGEDKTVVGVTSQVTGTISVDPADPAGAQIGTITIDARDLTTDNSRRNRSIQRQVLRSVLDENRFITFEPDVIEGMPDAVTIGEPFSFTVSGDLTVRGETRPETFDLTATALSPAEISGKGTTVVRYEDYGISIPSVPAVARVDEEVRLELEFVADASE